MSDVIECILILLFPLIVMNLTVLFVEIFETRNHLIDLDYEPHITMKDVLIILLFGFIYVFTRD